ncbi:hypothetical protein DY000_02041004 [Brassica cretica]|uniref:Zinc knuckle CX2CX4HX4C domain-containing protein n=1 Tax=Brassica cretica TaxID=69181 RepID=A0ABQ7BF08_BRACR|nr:hypothetical protein DY000_02041004 [Brassica cretica]
MTIDATSARIQISVNIDKPLQFEGAVGFPNGDTRKVTFLYVGLHRYCFTCKMISHDENSCPELTEAQREQKRLQRLALNNPGAQLQIPAYGPGQERKQGSKRPRSPSLDLQRQSPPHKFQTDASYGRNKRNETEDEKRKRLKGKVIMPPLDATPMSKAKDATSLAILIGRNTVIIGDQPSLRPASQRALIGQTAENAQGRKNASIESATPIATATREEEFLDVDMLTEEQAKQVIMTAEDEAEVDRIVSEFDDVIMDENMMENDDLLVDESGFDAEKIDAISQLSPMQVQNEPDEAMGPKNQSPHSHEKAQRAEQESKKHAASAQSMLEVPSDRIATDKGVAKKKSASSADVKGARASKKLAAQRGRASPKKSRGPGIPPKSASQKVPRNEVFPSANSKNSLSFSGSMVSQKPPRSGHLVVHRNETEDEKRKRLKGKVIMPPLDATPMSKAKDATSLAILIGRNTVIIGDQPSLRPASQRALIGQTAENAQGRKNASIERATPIATATREEEFLDVDMLTEEQAKQVIMTAEDEAEVDRIVSEFDDVIMDENMMENDDLLVDESGFDVEKIDAISQLSPMQVQNEPDEAMGPKNQSPHSHEKAQRAEHESKKHAASAQSMLEVPSDRITIDKGVAKKKPASSADVSLATLQLFSEIFGFNYGTRFRLLLTESLKVLAHFLS